MSSEEKKRVGRYTRLQVPLVSLTPIKLELLRFVVECRVLTLHQLATMTQRSYKGVQRQMRTLFNAELVDIVPIARLALASDDLPNTAELLHGTAPNLYVPTIAAVKLLVASGSIAPHYLKRSTPKYGPRQTPFLRHELIVRDVRVWLERLHQAGSGTTLRWEDGPYAHLDLQPLGVIRPDAWFVFELNALGGMSSVLGAVSGALGAVSSARSSFLVALIEVDRGTERGRERWSEKIGAYAALFCSGCLADLTGYQRARVLVVCNSEARRDTLVALIAELAGEIELPGEGENVASSGKLAERFWLTTADALQNATLSDLVWRRPGRGEMVPLVNS